MNIILDAGAVLFEILLVAILAILGLREAASGRTRRAAQRVRVRAEWRISRRD